MMQKIKGDSWGYYIQPYLNKNELGKINGMCDLLVKFAEKDFSTRNTLYPQLKSPFNCGSVYAYSVENDMNRTFNSEPFDAYIYRIARETMDAVNAEIKRLEICARNSYNIKIADKVYNPLYNRVGYVLESGETIFTDEKVTESDYVLNTDNFLRKVKLDSIIKGE
jgi:hypothetical protein